MARHTIGDKRGSVRGAPPDAYIPFGSFHDSEEDAAEAFKPVIKFFTLCVKGAGWLLFFWLLMTLGSVLFTDAHEIE